MFLNNLSTNCTNCESLKSANINRTFVTISTIDAVCIDNLHDKKIQSWQFDDCFSFVQIAIWCCYLIFSIIDYMWFIVINCQYFETITMLTIYKNKRMCCWQFIQLNKKIIAIKNRVCLQLTCGLYCKIVKQLGKLLLLLLV